MITYGRRSLGMTDAVPGVFHVKTQFYHFDYMPLIPIATYLIAGNRAIQMPLSIKSIIVAWLRFLSPIAVAIFGFLSFKSLVPDTSDSSTNSMSPVPDSSESFEPPNNSTVYSSFAAAAYAQLLASIPKIPLPSLDLTWYLVLFSLSAIMLYQAYFGRLLNYASYERAINLCSCMGAHEPIYRRRVDRYFGTLGGAPPAQTSTMPEDRDVEVAFRDEENRDHGDTEETASDESEEDVEIEDETDENDETEESDDMEDVEIDLEIV